MDEQRRIEYRLRAGEAKEFELAAHLRAVRLHESAAEVQARLGHHERATAALLRADRARASYEEALAEQAAALRRSLPVSGSRPESAIDKGAAAGPD